MLNAINHGWLGVFVVYGLAALGIGVGFRVRRADPTDFWRVPLIAIPASILAVIGWAAIQAMSPGVLSGMSRAESIIAGLGFVALSGYGAGLLYALRGGAGGLERGTLLVGLGGLRTSGSARQLSLAGIPVPPGDETKHFKLVGTTGTGKSTAIRELLSGALSRSDRAVIADPDGSYLRAFHDPARGDVILNPFDARAACWDLFAEIKQLHDADQLARSMIPDYEGGDRNWRHYARTFLSATLRQLHRVGERDLARLYRLLVYAPAEELRELLAETPAGPFLGQDIGKFFESVRSVVNVHVAALEHVARQAGGERIAVRDWIRRGRGVLFLPYRASEIAALRTLVSTWMRLAIFETMNAEEGDQRLWFVVDELDALGAIDGLKDALARLRKFGGRCVLGFQSIGQVSTTYGQGEAQTIVENCGNTLILRCSASEQGGTAKFASRLIGEREVVRRQESRSRRSGEWRSTRTVSQHHVIEPAVLPSEIEQLPDRSGYLKLASEAAWSRIRL